jgi:hypothetical protein
MTHEEARTIMRRIANDYDRLAKLAEEQLADQEKKSDWRLTPAPDDGVAPRHRKDGHGLTRT